jgi:hypothetical protein
MPGYVYIFTNRTMPGLVKIGSTTLTPSRRAKQLHTTGVASPYEVYAARKFYDHVAAEKKVHAILAPYRESTRREFFRRPPDAAEKVLEEVFRDLGGPRSSTAAANSGLRSIVGLILGIGFLVYLSEIPKSAPVIPNRESSQKEELSRTWQRAEVARDDPSTAEKEVHVFIDPTTPLASVRSEKDLVVDDQLAPATSVTVPSVVPELPRSTEDLVSVSDLAEWYLRDRKVAEEKFRGKLIRLKGTVVKAKKQELDFGPVHCRLNDAPTVAPVAGQVVLIEGIVSGSRKKGKISVVGCDLLPQP